MLCVVSACTSTTGVDLEMKKHFTPIGFAFTGKGVHNEFEEEGHEFDDETMHTASFNILHAADGLS